MPNINVEISDDLLKQIRIRCAEENVSQKDWVPRVLAEAVSSRLAREAGDEVAGVPCQKREG